MARRTEERCGRLPVSVHGLLHQALPRGNGGGGRRRPGLLHRAARLQLFFLSSPLALLLVPGAAPRPSAPLGPADCSRAHFAAFRCIKSHICR